MSSITELTQKLRTAIEAVGLSRVAEQIVAIAQPAVLIELQACEEAEIPVGGSKIGGNPDLPADYTWPQWKGKPIGFIGQIDLAQASKNDLQGLLPTEGLLSFFYDLYEQPWGYDPKEQGFSRIEYFPSDVPLTRQEVPESEIRLKCSAVILSPSLTIPVLGSQAYETFEAETQLSDTEQRKYWELPDQLQTLYRKGNNPGHHRLLGHSHNIQDDMQLEAELVTNGLYCGDSSGYKDPRAELLKPLSTQWQLLFQLDSDDIGGFMWGDSGMLYYWICRTDLINRQFERHWMTMQCC